ncbi:hypothetical protein A2U01_0017439, partial [Trifolium medium]|nr:hypothetical protein [Trifolium medium]
MRSEGVLKKNLSEKETLTGGVAVALTTKEPFLEDPIEEGSDLAP